MRDLFFLVSFPVFLFFIIKRPFIGVGLWIWTALFFPNAWVYGAAGALRYNLIFASLTISIYLFSKKPNKFTLEGISVLVLIFWIWTTISTSLTIGNPAIAWEIWIRFSKVVLLFLFIILIVNNKLHIDFFLWCLVFSVGFYGFLEALKYIASGGGHNIRGFHGHVLGDRNELALAFVMVLPVFSYLMSEYGTKSLMIKYGFIALLFMNIVAVIGTSSRGGLIALLFVTAFYFIKSDRKITLMICGAVAVTVLGTLIPPEWFDRMDTIKEAEADDSFASRTMAWKQSIILALQNPFFGGGFKSLEYLPVWESISRSYDSIGFFDTGDARPNVLYARAAHSIYFQVLGDHGFIGFAIFVLIIIASLAKAQRISKRNRQAGGELWINKLLTMLTLSIVAYCIGGSALSIAYFDLIFSYFALILAIGKYEECNRR